MKIILGTKSSDKKKILLNNLENFNLKNFLIEDVSVNSGVSDQPLSEEETVLGARNRAMNAINNYDEYNDDCIGVGLEGGLCNIKNNLYLVCVSCLIDKDKNEYIGISSKIAIPKIVSNKIQEGGSFGVLIREYADHYINDYYLNELISREKSFSEAIRNSLIVFLNQNNGEQSLF